MKIKIGIFTVILCLISMVTMANELFVFSVKKTDVNTIALQLTHVNQPEINVNLKDANGNTLYQETLEQNRLEERKYDLHQLPFGDYTLIVAYDHVLKIQPIRKDYNSLEISADEVYTIFQPTFRQHDEYVDLNMLCLGKQKLAVRITDSEGNVIHSERNLSNGSFQKRFNFSQLTKGNYTITLGIDDAIINKEFKQLIKWSPAIAAN